MKPPPPFLPGRLAPVDGLVESPCPLVPEAYPDPGGGRDTRPDVSCVEQTEATTNSQ